MEIYNPPKSNIVGIKKSKNIKFIILNTIFVLVLVWIGIQSIVTFQAANMYSEFGSKMQVYGALHMLSRLAFVICFLISIKFLNWGFYGGIISVLLIAAVETWFSMRLSAIVVSWWYFPVLLVSYYLIKKRYLKNA